MRSTSSRLLYWVLFLYAAVSMTYYIAGTLALRQEFFHGALHAEAPFDFDQGRTITNAGKRALPPGITKGDLLESLNGSDYTGRAQFNDFLRHARPGDPMQVVVRGADGRTKQVPITLHAWEKPGWTLGGYIAFLTPLLLVPLLSLIVGYWVVAARPRDPNAWLVLVLLTVPEVGFGNLDWRFWGGAWSTLLGLWNLIVEHALFIALLWFALYFPDRWRFDVRWPWIKWTLTAALVVGFADESWLDSIDYFDVSASAPLILRAPWIDAAMAWIEVICVALFLLAVFDKLRTSTADARRRLRVLAVGSAVSLGGMMILQGVLPTLGVSLPEGLFLTIVVPLFILFPLTLAYVVVVQRAMNLRILLRTGTKYLLAKATLIVLQIAFVALLVFRVIVPAIERHQRDSGMYSLLVAGVVAIVFRVSAIRQRISITARLHKWLDRKFFREAYNAELVLSELSDEARSFSEQGPLVETVSRRISEVLHVSQIAVWLRGANVFQLREAMGLNLMRPVLLLETSATVQNLARTNRPATVYRDRPEEWLEQATPDERNALDAVNAELLLPLPGREHLMGVMALGPKRSEEPYTSMDLRLLQSVATQTGLALEVSALAHSLAQEAGQRERMNREIEIAREVQQRLFPQRLPQIPGVSLAGMCRPALGVGGDYYDLIDLQDGRIGIAVGDVSGKGISAALLMASLRASLRGMTLEGSSDLAKTMKQVNRLVYESSANNRYATFFFATYNPATRELHYVNAGHNPPMLMRSPANGAADTVRLETGGLVVGLLPVAEYAEAYVTVEPGDVLLTYTDGISEAMTEEDEEWGEERMLAAAQAARTGSAEEILDIFRAADEFTAGAAQHDDMTLLLMKLEASRAVL